MPASIPFAFWKTAAAGGTPISFVQAKEGSNSFGGASSSSTFDSSVTAGNLIIVGVNWSGASVQTLSSVTDSLGNSYTVIAASYAHRAGLPSADLATQVAWCVSGSSGTNTVTANLTGGSNVFCNPVEATAGIYDQASGGTGSSTTPSAGSITTPSSGCFGVAVMINEDGLGGGNTTPGTGWTRYQNTGGGSVEQAAEYQAVALAGSITGDFSRGGIGLWSASMATFKP